MSVDLATSLIAVQTTILVLAIPWAMSVHGRLIGVELAFKHFASLIGDVSEMKKEIAILKQQVRTYQEERK